MRSGLVLTTDPVDYDRVAETIERVRPSVDEVVVSCRDEHRDELTATLDPADCRFAVDPVPDRGPVAGIRSGCRVARGSETFVTADSTPSVRPELIDRLFESVEYEGVVSRLGGQRRPLIAVYDTDAAVEAAETTLGLGSGAVDDLLDRIAVTTVPITGPTSTRESTDE
jgi:molybdopterin-guanine dinucleotide biosynthesis protein A